LAPGLPTLLARLQTRSKANTARLASRLSNAGLPILSGLKPLEPLPSPPELKFPTFRELVEQELTESPQPEANDGLFSQLVQDPAILYREYLDDPDRFEESAGLLLQQLYSGLKNLEELTPEEMKILDQATVEFAQYLAKPKTPSESQRAAQPRSAIPSDDEPEIPWTDHVGGPSLPAMELPVSLPDAPTFWWKK
jgi:hypothetical protein